MSAPALFGQAQTILEGIDRSDAGMRGNSKSIIALIVMVKNLKLTAEKLRKIPHPARQFAARMYFTQHSRPSNSFELKIEYCKLNIYGILSF